MATLRRRSSMLGGKAGGGMNFPGGSATFDEQGPKLPTDGGQEWMKPNPRPPVIDFPQPPGSRPAPESGEVGPVTGGMGAPAGRGSETPREREAGRIGGAQATPTQLRAPTPMAGSTTTLPTPGVMPFQPMGMGGQARPGLFGGTRGLTRGGLGTPGGPDPAGGNQISQLISMLLALRGR